MSFLFGNLETVYAIHAAFLTSLERQFSLWPHPGWGGFAGAFKMFFNALRTVLASLGTNPQVHWVGGCTLVNTKLTHGVVLS